MRPEVHIWSSDRSARLFDVEGLLTDADDLAVGDVIQVGGKPWSVRRVEGDGDLTEVTIEPADEWPGLPDGDPPLFARREGREV